MSDVNYEYFAAYLKRIPNWRSLRVLDYGCGNGDMVRFLRNRGIDCYGTDLYDVVTGYSELNLDLRRAGLIKPLLHNGWIPFFLKFDVIISNQVFEHVDDLDTAFKNINRVLKTNGTMHHHFPCKEVIREGHIGIPCAHWFDKGKLRFLYAYMLRWLGFGCYKEGHSDLESWTTVKLDWMDRHCVYRDFEEIEAIVTKYGYRSLPGEMDYIEFRCQPRPVLNSLLKIDQFRWFYVSLFRRMGFRVIDLVHSTPSFPLKI